MLFTLSPLLIQIMHAVVVAKIFLHKFFVVRLILLCELEKFPTIENL